MAPQAHARGMPVGVPARGGSGRGKFLAPGADVPATAIGIQPCNREPQPKPEKAVSVAIVIHSRAGPVIWRDDYDHPSRLSRPRRTRAIRTDMDATIGNRFQTADRHPARPICASAMARDERPSAKDQRGTLSTFGDDPSFGHDQDRAARASRPERRSPFHQAGRFS